MARSVKFCFIFLSFFFAFALQTGEINFMTKKTFWKSFGTCLTRSKNLVGIVNVVFEISSLQNWKILKTPMEIHQFLRKSLSKFIKETKFFNFINARSRNLPNQIPPNFRSVSSMFRTTSKKFFLWRNAFLRSVEPI